MEEKSTTLRCQLSGVRRDSSGSMPLAARAAAQERGEELEWEELLRAWPGAWGPTWDSQGSPLPPCEKAALLAIVGGGGGGQLLLLLLSRAGHCAKGACAAANILEACSCRGIAGAAASPAVPAASRSN